MQPLDEALMGSLKTFYCQEIEKWLRSNPRRVVTVQQIGELFGNAYKRTETDEIATNVFQATGLFPCDKNISRPCDFTLSSEDKDAASINHPALVKTNDQPSFSSANVLLFAFSEALRSSDISHVPNLNLKPNLRGGTVKKIMSPPYKKIVDATQKKKIKQATKSKTSWLATNVLLCPLKRRKRIVRRYPTPPDTPSDSHTYLDVSLADDLTEENEEQDADCVFCTGRFSEDHNGED
jgi:hypothetical protein